jgi:hypothetical protein
MFVEIKNNRVTNRIVADQSFIDKLPGTYIKSEDANIGDIYDHEKDKFYPEFGPNGYILDSDELEWIRPLDPSDSDTSYYWSYREGSWVVDNRPPKPVVLEGTTDYWIWAENEVDPNLDAWHINIDDAVGRAGIVIGRTESFERLKSEMLDTYQQWLLANYETGEMDAKAQELYEILQKVESWNEDNFYRDSEIVYSYDEKEWRI